MQPHPRIRKTIKWGGAVVTVLLVAMWGASARRTIGWVFPNGTWLAAGWGVLQVTQMSDPFPVPVYGAWYTDMPATDGGWWYGEFRATLAWQLHFRAWSVALGAFATTAAAWWLDAVWGARGTRRNLCKTCGYDRAGLAVSAVCPECGRGAE